MILHSKPLRLQRYYKKMTYANLYAIFCKFITLTPAHACVPYLYTREA